MQDLTKDNKLVSNSTKTKPDWIRVKAPVSPQYHETAALLKEHKLHTVCEEAACPNVGECWEKKHATMMILGDMCTRACSFCNIKTGKPGAVDPFEPFRVADAVQKLGLSHVVITSVDRDDLDDGGSQHFVEVIQAIRKMSPNTTIEILTPDFLRKDGAIEKIVAVKPDVFNHNLETVPRLYPSVRPGARYYHSLRLLDTVKTTDPTLFTKSGIMLGLGEERHEVMQVMDDLRAAQVDFLTIGQYLQPTPKHHSVIDYVTPEQFDTYASIARSKGFLMIASSPLTRSSYHAGDDYKIMKERRLEQYKDSCHGVS